jgi:DNA-binding response OmpR family regulator
MKTRHGRIQRVLVVDDEKAISDSLALILTKSGFVARSAYSGEQAIELARSFEPELIITDVLMPGISGIEAVSEILAFLPTCKVIVFSGQANTIDVSRRHSVSYEILPKPLPPNVLLEHIAKLACLPEISGESA